MSNVYFCFTNKLVCCLGESISNLRAESSSHSLNFIWFVTRNKASICQKPAAREPEHLRKFSQKVPEPSQLLRKQRRKSSLMQDFERHSPVWTCVKEHMAELQAFKCQSLGLDTVTLNQADTFWWLRNVYIFHWTKTMSIHAWLEVSMDCHLWLRKYP